MQHAEIAQNNLDWVENHNPGFAQADIAVKAAQVHATLALVEQQRIANLIAAPKSYLGRIPDEDWERVNAEIKTGLGL